MARNLPPSCDLDWGRYFCLPVGVPPAGLTAAERVQYSVNLDVAAAMPVGTHGHYFAAPPQLAFRVAGAPPSQPLLPRHGRALVATADVSLNTATINPRLTLLNSTAFHPGPPAAGSVEAVDTQLQAKVPLDERARGFAPLPMPRLGLDTVEMFFADQANPWLPATLMLDEAGALDDQDAPTDAVPPLLLTTSKMALGELDRLLLRAPVTGRYRFDPYYVYRLGPPNTLGVVGPSASGRLLIEQPALGGARKAENSRTQLFEARTFAFDHVARADVAALLHAQLMFQLAHLGGISAAFRGEAGATASLAIPGSSPEVMDWVVAGVSRMLRAWVAFLSVLRWRAEDIAVASAIPAEWTAKLKKDAPGRGDAKALTAITAQITATDEWRESLVTFARNVYAPRLSGYSWTEVLASNGQAAARFPVPKDQPPFTASDAASKARQEQHHRLRLIEDPGQRWVACWAGAPMGRPSPVYATAPSAGAFPPDGVTTYELESLHSDGLAAGALGIAAPAATTGPAPGRAADLAAFAAKHVGYACWFSVGPLAANPLHTTADWLIELTQGLHFFGEEEPFLDLMSLVDRTDAAFAGHPLVVPLRTDLHEKAVRARAQMDAVGMAGLATASLAWWDSKVGFAKVGSNWHHVNADGSANDNDPSPSTPYLSGTTRGAPLTGVMAFDDLIFGTPSGFAVFDIESAWLASERMRIAPAPGLPLPVVLALMEREGIKQFAPINRRVRYTRTAANTLAWEALRRANVVPGARNRADYPAADDQMARVAWLSYPYGLDRYAEPLSDAAVDARLGTAVAAGVFTPEPGESVARYIRSRVWATFVASPAPIAPRGTPRIWKLHRRMHWAAISLMIAYYREMEAGMLAGTGAFADGGWVRDPAWVTPPPDLTGKTPADPEWRDYLSYYGMIYLAHNGGPPGWRTTIRSAETAMAGSPLQYRNFLLFKHRRDRVIIGNMVRFVIGLDAFLRVQYLDGVAPTDFAASAADMTPAANRTAAAWGV